MGFSLVTRYHGSGTTVVKKNLSVLSTLGKDSSVHLMYNDSCELRSLIDPDPDHPKGTYPKTAYSPWGSLVRNEHEYDYEYEIFQILFAYY